MLGRNSAAATELPAEPRGCVLNATEASYIENFLMMKSSGLSRVDQAVASEIPAIKDAFRIDAEFSYINDRYGRNAFAIPRSTPPKAMVVLGIRMMHLAIGSSAPIEAGQIPPRFPSATAGTVAAILAHEWAHVLQFHRTATTLEPTVRPLELQADYLAGWYMARKNVSTIEDVKDLERDFNSFGDDRFTQRNHHGTPEERGEALRSGFALARSGANDIDIAFRKGAERYGLSYS